MSPKSPVDARMKTYAAFLSFADPDRELVQCLRDLIVEIGSTAYYAPSDLPESGSPQWRAEILKGIRDSTSFVPIYSRHSLKRPWVLYESGVADALKLPRFPARFASVSCSDIDDLPGPGAFVYDISERGALSQLLINVVSRHTGEDKPTVALTVNRCLAHSVFAARICTLARTRWVFVAGNYPVAAARSGSGIDWFSTREEFLTRLRDFVGPLTELLLEEGFSVMACPQVDAIGHHVIVKATDFISSPQHRGEPVDYAIGGIHPIDREARESGLSEEATRKWLDHIMEFRRTYLAGKEWIILLGGNEGTVEEYHAAAADRAKVVPVPCFGGAAARIFAEGPDYGWMPCAQCQEKSGRCGETTIRRLVSAMKGR